MSFTSKKKNNSGVLNLPIAIVEGGDLEGNVIYLKGDEIKPHVIQDAPITKISLPNTREGKFAQLPNQKTRVLYIAGPSGSGKSTYCANYIKKYLALHPKSRFIVFSRLDADAVIDDLKPKRIMVDDSLINDPIEIEMIDPGTIILFDDCECVTDSHILDAINKIKIQVLELGRHTDIHVVITSHSINGTSKNMSRTVLNEMHSLTIFPSAGSHYQIKYVLKQYFGLSTKQIKSLLDIKSRFITIIKSFPQMILSQNELIFVSDL